MKKSLLAALFAWYVVTYSGQIMAGPFTLLSDCNDIAKAMHKKNVQVSELCRSK